MGQHEVAALQDAKFDNSPYSWNFTKGNYLLCGYVKNMFVMTGE